MKIGRMYFNNPVAGVFQAISSVSLLMMSTLLFADNEKPKGPPPSVVEATLAKEQSIAPTLWVPGTVISRFDSNIASETNGIITSIVEVGEKIEQGQLLAKVNDQQLVLQLRHDEADLKKLEAQRQHAQKQLERSKTLSKTDSASQSQIDELTMQRDVLLQDIELAKVRLAQTQYLNNRTNILAPFSGVVVERFQNTGEYLAIGEEVLRLVSTEELEVSVRAPVESSQFVLAGQTVPVKNKRQEVFTQVRNLVPVGDIRSRMLEVRIHLLDNNWVIGEPVEVALNNGPQQIETVVPRDALVLRNDSVYIFKVIDGRATKIDVVPGIGDASNIAIHGKVKPGDLIITRGAERLDDGNPVQVLESVASK